MRCLLSLTLTLVVVFMMSSNASAQAPNMTFASDTSYGRVIMPQLFSTSVLIDDDDTPPAAPNIFKVKFLRLPPLNGIDERVDRLVQGIKVDLPPEYDHYGYEIRRYMSKVGEIKIFTDNEFLLEQIKNVRKSQIIADYWKKHLDKEIGEIEKIIESNEDTPFTVRTAFRQNKVTVRSFIVDLKAWIEANNVMLSNIYKHSIDNYDVVYPEIIITSSLARQTFYNDMTVKQNKLTAIKAYHPFAIMVY